MKKVVIRLPLTKGEGTLPSAKQSLGIDFLDLSDMCTFYLSPTARETFSENSRIRGARILYNGVKEITRSGVKYGLNMGISGIEGYPCPIVAFEVEGLIDTDELRRAVWESSVRVLSQSGDSEFFFEDWNGYTEVLDSRSIKSWTMSLRRQNIHPSKLLSLSEMEDGVCLGSSGKKRSVKRVS